MLAKVSHHYRFVKEVNDDIKLGDDLITDINGHPTQFPVGTFGAVMTAFATIHTTYKGLVIAASGGDAAAVAARNTYRASTWLPKVDEIANLVDIQSGGDPGIILLSGFHATKTTKDIAVTPVQMTLDVSSPGNGQLNYESKTKVASHEFLLIGVIDGHAIINEDGDVISIETSVPTTVTIVTTHSKKGSVKNLASGAKMQWAIRAMNAAGSGLLSKLIKLLIQ